MNVYQKVLVKLYEETDGRATKAVYLKDIVKDLGFYPSYPDIFSHMSHDGWITETSRSNEVNITPWGIREAEKLKAGVTDNSREIERVSGKLKTAVKQLLVVTEELVEDVSEEKLKEVEGEVAFVKETVSDLKSLL